MPTETLGQFLAIGGLLLLILGSWGRRRPRRLLPRVGAAGFLKGLLWTDLLAYALILAGLLIMWAKR